MSASPSNGPCRVVGAAKLPPEVGGPAAICAAFEQAITARAPKVRYSAEIRVLSPSGLAIRVEVGGRKLEEQHFGVMDRNLNPGSIHRFARNLADIVAQAAKA